MVWTRILSASLIEIGTAMGYVPTPTAAADQYMSLSQGIVDGADHALWAHQTWKLTEIAKHYSDTRHALQCVFFIMNNDSLASLPEEYQKIVLDTFAEVEKELAEGSLCQVALTDFQTFWKYLETNSAC